MAQETQTVGNPAPVVGATQSSPMKFMATLKEGQTYFYGNQRFNQGVRVPVTAELAAILKAEEVPQTVMKADNEFETQYVDRFVITPLAAISDVDHESEEGPVVPTRTRTRQR